jgi:hypothetical protein
VYNPLHWSSANLTNVWHDLFGAGAFAADRAADARLRRGRASLLSLLIAYPAAYFVSPVRRPAQGPVPGAADRAVLDQLHDAHAGLDRPAADRTAT